MHEQADDLLRPFFHALDVKIDLSADLVLGGLIFFRGVGVGVMGGTSVAAGDDHPFAGLFLDVIEKIDQDRIDVFFAADEREAVAGAPFAIGKPIGG